MRHDPASAALVVMLRGLKMFGMAQAVGELMEQGAPAFEAAVPILSQLLKAELAEREVRSIAYQTKTARFPAYKDLASFDFAASEINEASVRQLHRGEFTHRADNIVLIGGPERRQKSCIHSGAGSEAEGQVSWSALSQTRRCDRGSGPAPACRCRTVAILSSGQRVRGRQLAMRAPQRLGDVTTCPGPGLGRRE